jgi:hypothetical protein
MIQLFSFAIKITLSNYCFFSPSRDKIASFAKLMRLPGDLRPLERTQTAMVMVWVLVALSLEGVWASSSSSTIGFAIANLDSNLQIQSESQSRPTLATATTTSSPKDANAVFSSSHDKSNLSSADVMAMQAPELRLFGTFLNTPTCQLTQKGIVLLVVFVTLIM